MLRVFNNTARYVDQGGNKVRIVSVLVICHFNINLTEAGVMHDIHSIELYGKSLIFFRMFYDNRDIHFRVNYHHDFL